MSNGSLSISQLIELWKSTVDPGYADSLISAGEGNGFEVYTQAFAMLARVSEAIERTRQSMFIRHWSGSADSGTDYEPSTGASKAEVTLMLTRDKHLEMPVYLQAGYFTVGEIKNDWGESGSVPVLTGRKYILQEDAVIHPGETGPIPLKMIAERSGYGYNIPLKDSISYIYQTGNGLNNDYCQFTQSLNANYQSSCVLDFSCVSEPDVLVPDNVGCYLQMFHVHPESRAPYADHLQVWRMNKYMSGNPLDVLDGGHVQFDFIISVEGTLGFSNLFPGLKCTLQPEPGGVIDVVLLGIRTGNDGITRATCLITKFFPSYDDFMANVGGLDVFLQSEGLLYNTPNLGAMSYTRVTFYPLFVNDINRTRGRSWKVLSWKDDLGISVTNPLSPTNGKTEWLDELGRERNIIRVSGENDESYRSRVYTISDVVSPNAIRRNVNNILKDIGLSCCLREPGKGLYGFFFENDAFDYSPSDLNWNRGKFASWFDEIESRGFFLVGIPAFQIGDFGFAYDATNAYFNAYDWEYGSNVVGSSFDGFAEASDRMLEVIKQTVDSIRAAGVGFELYLETGNCSV